MKKSWLVLLLTVLIISLMFTIGCSNQGSVQEESGVDNYDVTLSDEMLSLQLYDNPYTVTASVYNNGILLNDAIIEWDSANTDVVTVNNGVITAKSCGETIITVKSCGVTKTINVEVLASEVPSLVLDESEVCFICGVSENYQVTAKVVYLSKTYTGNEISLQYSIPSGGELVATVDQNGLITPKIAGETTLTISATYHGYNGIGMTKTIPIIVNEDVEVHIELKEDNENVIYLKDFELEGEMYSSKTYFDFAVFCNNEGTFDEVQEAVVTWKTGDETIATVDANGQVSAVSQGNTTVWCEYLYKGKVYESERFVIVVKPYIVVYKYNDTVIYYCEVAEGENIENNGINGFSNKWQLEGVDYDLSSPITDNTVLVATGDLFSDFNFEGENSDTISYEMVGNSKYDLKRSEQTLWGIERPVGRPDFDTRIQISSNPVICYWKFIITPEIVNAFKLLGYKYLTFDVVLFSDSNQGIAGSTITFLNKTVTVTDVANDTVKHVSLDIDAFGEWVESGMGTCFMQTCGINGIGRIIVGNFAFERERMLVTYKYKDIVIGSTEVLQGNTLEDNAINSFSTEWQLNGEVFDFATPITESITLVATGELSSYEFNFEGENADTISYEKTGTAKWDLKRSEDTIEGIVRPVGRPTGFGAGGMNVVCIWKFIITPEIVSAYKEAGYNYLSFDVYISASTGITSNSCSFFGESIVVDGFANGVLKHVDLSIDAFATWVAGGMDNSFMITPPCQGTNTIIAVGNFEFTKEKQQQTAIVTFKYNDAEIGTTEVEVGETLENEDMAKLSSSWKLNGESYDLSTPITAGITLVTEELSYVFEFEGENSDTISYEIIGQNSKWDLKRSEDAVEGIVRPVGRPAGINTANMAMTCIWKFKITPEIVTIFKTAGYTHLSFDVYISASTGIASSSCSFLGESIVIDGFENGTVKHVDLSIDEFATWVSGGMSNSFMITPPCQGDTIFAVGNFEFTTKNQD